MAPAPTSKVFFTNSGSEANDTQIKIAWYYNNSMGRPKKKKIISRQRAYHGTTIASASLSGLSVFHADFDLPMARVLHTDCPHYGKYAEPGESEQEYATRLARSLETLIESKLRIVPPGIGIVHQVNLEYLAQGVLETEGVVHFDSLVGTDSHTPMINGLGVVGWGVGGIEAEAGMLGQPVSFLTPDVVGVRMRGRAARGGHGDGPRSAT